MELDRAVVRRELDEDAWRNLLHCPLAPGSAYAVFLNIPQPDGWPYLLYKRLPELHVPGVRLVYGEHDYVCATGALHPIIPELARGSRTR